MREINLPILSGSINQDERTLPTLLDEDEELNLPFTMGMCVTFRYIPQVNKFNFIENKEFALEIIQGKLSQTDFEQDIEILNNPRNFNSPSLCIKIMASAIFIILVLKCFIIFLFLWSIFILDLVFAALGYFIIKKVIMYVWV